MADASTAEREWSLGHRGRNYLGRPGALPFFPRVQPPGRQPNDYGLPPARGQDRTFSLEGIELERIELERHGRLVRSAGSSKPALHWAGFALAAVGSDPFENSDPCRH